jgi:hypothetical protein
MRSRRAFKRRRAAAQLHVIRLSDLSDPMSHVLVSAATFVLGVLPATPLVFFSILLGVMPIIILFSADAVANVVLWKLLVGLVACPVLCAGAVLGYAGLFQAALGGPVTRPVVYRLLAGVLASVIGMGFVATQWWFSRDALWLFAAPLAVACTHVIWFSINTRRRGASV